MVDIFLDLSVFFKPKSGQRISGKHSVGVGVISVVAQTILEC